jgi:hypothetical protein
VKAAEALAPTTVVIIAASGHDSTYPSAPRGSRQRATMQHAPRCIFNANVRDASGEPVGAEHVGSSCNAAPIIHSTKNQNVVSITNEVWRKKA